MCCFTWNCKNLLVRKIAFNFDSINKSREGPELYKEISSFSCIKDTEGTR